MSRNAAHTLHGFAPDVTEMVPVTVPERLDELQRRYDVGPPIGEGGMGVVHRVRHVMLGRDFALKLLRPEHAADPQILERMHREALSAARVDSPHTVEVNDFGRLSDGTPYIVMELLEGRELSDELQREARLPWDRVAGIALQCCDALSKVHREGIVHRDLKPENLFLVDRPGGEDFIKILDFGLAKVAGSASLSRAGMAIGTPSYMSPEQCAGEATEASTDLYSMGCVLYELLSGRPPFVEASYSEVLIAHITKTPTPIDELVPDLPPEAAALVMRCLEKDAEWRFESADALAEAIRGVDLGIPERSGTRRIPESRRRGAPIALPAPAEPSNALVWTLALALMGSVAALSAAFVLVRPSTAPPPPFAASTAPQTFLLTTDPEGADVRIDGASRGRTPLSLTAEEASAGEVELSLEGHAPRRLRLAPEVRGTVRVYLDPEP
ncbi:MAG: serine/threonine-protein kinase [Sandaracinaceae bacterium]